MKIEARHVKRKQLSQYLETEFLKKERKLFQQYSALVAANNTVKRSSSASNLSASQPGQTTPGSIKRQRVSESVSRWGGGGGGWWNIGVSDLIPNALPFHAAQFEESPMATPNTSMTATGLGNSEGGDHGVNPEEITRELMETLDRYTDSGEEKQEELRGGDKLETPPPQELDDSRKGDEDATTTTKTDVEEKSGVEEEEEVQQQAAQSTNSSTAAEVMCS